MELFDVVNAVFSKTEWKKVSRIDKEKYFFMVNRFMSIGLPKQASMFNIKHIPKSHVLDYWNRQLAKLYSRIPSWIYTKGEKASKEEKNKIKVDYDLMRFFCEKNECSISEFNLLLEINPKELQIELDMLEQVLKARNSRTSNKD
jgi:hypothetical protein